MLLKFESLYKVCIKFVTIIFVMKNIDWKHVIIGVVTTMVALFVYEQVVAPRLPEKAL